MKKIFLFSFILLIVLSSVSAQTFSDIISRTEPGGGAHYWDSVNSRLDISSKIQLFALSVGAQKIIGGKICSENPTDDMWIFTYDIGPELVTDVPWAREEQLFIYNEVTNKIEFLESRSLQANEENVWDLDVTRQYYWAEFACIHDANCDRDGPDAFISSFADNGVDRLRDECKNANVVKDAQCTDDGTLFFKEYDCTVWDKTCDAGKCVGASTPFPVIIPTTDDSDGDGVGDDKDKCPSVAGRSNVDPLGDFYGCPLVFIRSGSVKVLGVNEYLQGERVPIMFQLFKDDDFDLTGLKVEVGIYKSSAPFLGTFSAVDPSVVLPRIGLDEITHCHPREIFVQAADINEFNRFAFGSGDNKNDATYVLFPQMPLPTSEMFTGTNIDYTIQVVLYRECGKPITSNSQSTVFMSRSLVALPKHNFDLFDGVACIEVSGTGDDECSPSDPDDPDPCVGSDCTKVCSKAVGDSCTNPDRAGTDDSGPDTECASGWCQDVSGVGGRCAIVGTLADGSKLKGAEPHPVCKDAGTTKSSTCVFLEDIAFFDVAEDKCTSGGIILVGGILLLLIIMAMFAGGKK